MKEIEMAWAAGFFEGEGSVRISKPAERNWGSLNIDIPNTKESLVRWFDERWEGSVHEYAESGNRKKYWRWRCASSKAAKFLRDIRPFIVSDLVREKIDVGLAFQDQKESRRSDETYRQTQWEAYWWMAELNTRGTCPNAQQHRRGNR